MNYILKDPSNFNVYSAYITDSRFADVKRRGRQVTWGAKEEQWRLLRDTLKYGTGRANKVVTNWIRECTDLHPEYDYQKFRAGFESVFPDDTISGLRAFNKQWRIEQAFGG